MSRFAFTTLIGLLVFGLNLPAQASLAWIRGTWTEQMGSKGTGRTPSVLQVELVDDVLRFTESGQDGDDMRCRIDGAETRSSEVKSKATVQYLLKCKISGQSIEIRGSSIASSMSGIPPQQFEIEQQFELLKNGLLHRRYRMRGIAQGAGVIDLADEKTDFVRSQ